MRKMSQLVVSKQDWKEVGSDFGLYYGVREVESLVLEDYYYPNQKLVLPQSQSVTFASVSRWLERKNNNCCKTKMSFIYNKKEKVKSKSKQIPNLATLRPAEMDLWIIFLYKQMAFFFHNNYCFFFNFKPSGYNGKCDGLWVW